MAREVIFLKAGQEQELANAEAFWGWCREKARLSGSVEREKEKACMPLGLAS